jgi:hypothetical protein
MILYVSLLTGARTTLKDNRTSALHAMVGFA